MHKKARLDTRARFEIRQERIAVVIMAIIVIPILYIYGTFFASAFVDQKTGDLTLSNFGFFVEEMKIGNSYIQPIWKPTKNTLIFTSIVTFCELLFSCMAGYALSRLNFAGKKTITMSLLILRMFPGVLLLIGVLYVLMYLKIANSLLGVILVAIAFRLPGSTFIIRNFFNQVPKDIENSALVDGCNRFTAFTQVIIHLVKPGIASTAMFGFMAAWSNYLLFNVLIFNSKTPVLATYLRGICNNDEMIADYGIFCAMSLVYMAPVLIFFFISQKQLMKGNMSGGKGI